MISYQWDSQERMLQLRDKLKAEDLSVWMDVDNIGMFLCIFYILAILITY